MSNTAPMLNEETTAFLNKQEHPFRKEIEQLRLLILNANPDLAEGVKWNAPNYTISGMDCITLKIFPVKNVQLIFHRGAKVQSQPVDKFIEDDSGLLVWKAADRAVATFNNLASIQQNETALTNIVRKWLDACSMK